MNLHTRSICDACHDALATIQRRGCWLCASCDGSVIPFSLPSVSCADVNAPAAAPQPNGGRRNLSEIPEPAIRDRQAVVATSPPVSPGVAAAADPGPCGWGSTDLESALASETMADGDHWPATAVPADPVVVDFEAEVAALEAGWRRDGISMNVTAFFTATVNSSADNNERAARNELHQAKLILARLEARLNSGDADFYRADIDGLRAATAGVGRSNLTKR